MRYQYLGDLPAVTPYQHGQDGVTLTRAVPKLSLVVPTVNDTDEPLPDEYEPAVEIGTIVIEPGDILEVDGEIVHAHFEMLDPDPDPEPEPEPEAEPETERQRKAREKREGKASAVGGEVVSAPGQAEPPQDSSPAPASSDAEPILTPETGAQPIDTTNDPATAEGDTTTKEG